MVRHPEVPQKCKMRPREMNSKMVVVVVGRPLIGRGEKTPTPKISALQRKRPVLLRANFVRFCGKMHREGSCSKAAGCP